MAEDTDGVAETFDESLRVALTVAAQLGERVSRLREQHSRQREADSRTESRELQARWDAERSAARAQLAVVDRPEWWDRASVADIAAVQETVSAWRDYDDTAAKAAVVMHDEIQTRYGIDTGQLDSSPAAPGRELDGTERDRGTTIAEQRRQASDELTATELALAGAERRDRARYATDREAWEQDDANNTGPAGYDSRERRAAFAQTLEGTASEQEIHGRILADLGNARHPRDAVARPGHRISQPGRGRVGAGQQRERGGLVR